MGKVFGIDLGTTYSCIAYIDEHGKPVVLKNAESEMTTPSVVYFESPEDITVGLAAKEEAIMHPHQSVSLIKRDMGQPGKNRTINGIEMRPEEISAQILKKVVKDAMDSLRAEGKLDEGEEIKDVVITCPAYFGGAEREATKKAGEIAGLNVLSIINEPTAAAINYGVLNDSQEKTVLVYDLGGGTFDVTVINIKNGEIHVIATGGNHVLGGADWDEQIKRHVAEYFESETGTPKEELLTNPETLQEISLAVEKAKKLLTAKKKAPIAVNYDGEKVRLELTREQFDELTADLLEQTISLTKDIFKKIEKKGFNQSQVNEILLVGGSSFMPQVMARVSNEFGIETKLHDPNEAVAKGAAVYANNMSIIKGIFFDPTPTPDNPKEMTEDEIRKRAEETGIVLPPYIAPIVNITNVSSRTYGIKIKGERISNIIYQNDELPANTTKTFYPAANNQSAVSLEVYESMTDEEVIALELGTELGSAELSLPPHTKTSDEIEVTFILDDEGVLKLKAKELVSGKEIEATFELKNGMSDEEMEAAKQRTVTAVVS